jgi:hypothetical protein
MVKIFASKLPRLNGAEQIFDFSGRQLLQFVCCTLIEAQAWMSIVVSFKVSTAICAQGIYAGIRIRNIERQYLLTSRASQPARVIPFDD